MTDIIQEIREKRAAFAARHNYDLRAMAETLRQLDAKDGRPLLNLPPRKPGGMVPDQTGKEAKPNAA